jgi:hypothetical protein
MTLSASGREERLVNRKLQTECYYKALGQHRGKAIKPIKKRSLSEKASSGRKHELHLEE